MKKAAFILFLVFVMGASIVYFLLHRLGPMSSARLVPGTTSVLLDFPDLAVSSQRWADSSFRKIITEPEVQAFFERPLDRFHQWTSSSADPEAIENLIVKIKPGRFFAAIEPIKESNAWVVGCQFFGKQADAEKGLTRLHEFLDKRFGAGEKIILNAEKNQGEMIVKSSHGSFVIYSALKDNWIFASNSLDVIKKSLDFSAGRRSEKESLAATTLYQKNRARLLSEGDLFFYAKPSSAVQMIPYMNSLLRSDGSLAKAESFGLSFCLSHEGIKEILFCGGNFPKAASITHQGINLTRPTTLGFIERTNDWNQVFQQLQNNKSLPPAFGQLLGPEGIDLSALSGFLSPETVFVFNWASGHNFPTGFIAVPPTDSMKVNSWLEQAATRLGAKLQSQGDLQLLTAPQLAESFKPTLAANRDLFFIGTEPGVIEQSIQQNNKEASSKTLKTTPGFSTKVDQLYHDSNEVFAYLSAQELFKHLYEKVRPGLLLGGSFMPGLSTTFDFAKLPSAETIAQHLTPIIYSQSHLSDGFRIESVGSLTFTPLFFVGVTTYPMMMKKKAAEGTADPNSASENTSSSNSSPDPADGDAGE